MSVEHLMGYDRAVSAAPFFVAWPKVGYRRPCITTTSGLRFDRQQAESVLWCSRITYFDATPPPWCLPVDVGRQHHRELEIALRRLRD